MFWTKEFWESAKGRFTKKLLVLIIIALGIVLLLVATGVIKAYAQSEVWIVADAASDVTEVNVIFDGIDEGWKPYQEIIIAGDAQCNPCAAIRRVDTEADGNHDTSVKYRNVWGESIAVPFAFKKSLPPDVLGIGLKRK